MGRTMTDQDIKKAAALRLLKRGLVTQSEAAALAGVSRQLVRHWARDLAKDSRDQYVAAAWSKAVLQLTKRNAPK